MADLEWYEIEDWTDIFAHENLYELKFKTVEDAQNYATKLLENYQPYCAENRRIINKKVASHKWGVELTWQVEERIVVKHVKKDIKIVDDIEYFREITEEEIIKDWSIITDAYGRKDISLRLNIVPHSHDYWKENHEKISPR